MSDQPERPTTLKRAPKSPPRPAPDSGVDPIDATPSAPVEEAAAPSIEEVASTTSVTPSGRQATVPLSTRISTEVDRVLHTAVAKNNLKVRAAIEEAILYRWGNGDS
ncbi:hypothetical protein [Microbacterium testaceum]|uniref:hypothetical protein n=1 Tax=Microbacterium testaceum TaxID=2033 RepID=UPI002AC481E8|nr:hypothetical protein [Microbacterium testaceum]MDZ5146368.1 hypothetical protein [Microbacterium testaceum]